MAALTRAHFALLMLVALSVVLSVQFILGTRQCFPPTQVRQGVVREATFSTSNSNSDVNHRTGVNTKPHWTCHPLDFAPTQVVRPLTDEIGPSHETLSVDTLPIVQLEAFPTTKEFYRYVHQSQPFVVRGGARALKIFQLWQNDTYLESKIGSVRVHVRKAKYHDNVFHYNRADSEYETMTFASFIQAVRDGRGDSLYLAQGNIQWLRNAGGLVALKPDLEPFGFDDFLDLKHIQLWMGYGEKRNPLHLDNNENLLVQVSGVKRFRVFSPGQREFLYAVARGFPSAVSSDINDIGKVDSAQYPCFDDATFADIEVHAGDVLFLPAYWWHQVQSVERSLAVNFWYETHSLMLKQMMKTLDLSVPLKESGTVYIQQPRW